MDFTYKENKKIEEGYWEGRHESGLSIYIIPKDEATSFSSLTVKYGGSDTEFYSTKGGTLIKSPRGTAHFLEHKLFEDENGEDTFLKFTALGVDSNAFTSNDITSYIASSADNIYQSLYMLMNMVFTPHFEEKSVEREKGIISEEIKMGKDSPYNALYKGLVRALYKKHTVRRDIAGSVKSVLSITPEMLYEAYNAFYKPQNMFLICAGRYEKEKVAEICDKILPKEELPFTALCKKVSEPCEVNRKSVSRKMAVAHPIISVAVKDTDFGGNGRAADPLRKQIENDIIMSILFGESSDFYLENYESGLIISSFDAGYSGSSTYGFSSVTAETSDPDAFAEKAAERINDYRTGRKVIGEEEFLAAKRVFYTDSVTSWNSSSGAADGFLDVLISGGDMLDIPELISTITLDDIKNRFMKFYSEEYMVRSVILPKRGVKNDN